MRGRVAAVHSLFIGASNELGEFESGHCGAVRSGAGGGAGTLLVSALWAIIFPELRKPARLVD
ncbi:hypothetical protein N181_03785 [Sinorhizobium fredii USDA 205]|uniref:hypothetical protein n=1 Tax=Rhizobium fredii TaxID=380 RepID=UPI0004B592CA|nr:MFS permease [Sinorhizobium fredii CCBAU 83666]KSV84335.1 hypothetical protein N181_03785 [Sinorhizobium fredii USDA 205]